MTEESTDGVEDLPVYTYGPGCIFDEDGDLIFFASASYMAFGPKGRPPKSEAQPEDE